jgi:multidrug resistance efflux pump
MLMPLGSAATGIVEALLVSEGDRVSAGQKIVRLDCRVGEGEVKAREAELATVTAALSRLKNGTRAEEIAITAASVRMAQARAEQAEKERQRVTALKDGIATTRARLEEVERDARTALGQLEQDRERLAMLRAGPRSEDIAEAKARRDAAAATLDQARSRLDQCSVRTPINGVVLSTHVTVGQFVGPMFQGPMVRIVDDSEQRVRAEVDERDLYNVCTGQEAVVSADGFPGETLTGRIVRINPSMGRRTILGTDPAEKSDRDIREVVLTLSSGARQWPVGLRVLARFNNCSGQAWIAQK